MADHDATQREEGLMDIGAAFVADAQAAELVQPRDGALDHPAEDAKVTILVGAALGQPGLDAADAQVHDVARPGVRLVGHHRPGTEQRSAHLALDLGDRVDQRDEEPAVGAVRARDHARERHALGVGREMMLAARLASIRGVRSRFSPAPTARTVPESAVTIDRSISSLRRGGPSLLSWMACQMPAAWQA